MSDKASDDAGDVNVDEVRTEALDQLRIEAAKLFAEKPQYRSLMMAVAQYWCDEAEDAVHVSLYASERELPLWPHRCAESYYGEDEIENVPGEACGDCESQLGYLDVDDNGSAIAGFEAYCHEAGSQEEDSASNYLPYAVARRRGDAIEIEVIGRLQRPEGEHYTHAIHADVEPDDTWDDPRARELFELVCATPDDDSPRRVLADYLLERDNPRGELIAVSLEAAHNADALTKRDDLLAAHAVRWMAPLAHVVPVSTARFERGFLVSGEVHAHNDYSIAAVRGALAWGTVESLYVHASSRCVLDPAMRALRELGPIDGDWLADLANATAPWAIESLDVILTTPQDVTALAAITTLPRLRRLTLRGPRVTEAVAQLPHAGWCSQLERLTVIDDGSPATWYARHRELAPLPWLAVAARHEDPCEALGWEVAFGPGGACEIALRGWHPQGSLDRLADVLRTLPPTSSLAFVASRFWSPTAADLERLLGSRDDDDDDDVN